MLEVGAFLELWLTVNMLSAVLAVSATAFYIFVYTILLKRTSSQNIVIGGAAGAVPVLVGWTAVTGKLALGAGRALRRHLHLDAHRTSGRSPSATARTTRRRTCRCSRS